MSTQSEKLEDLSDYKRYGRQMIIDGFGLPGVLLFPSRSVE